MVYTLYFKEVSMQYAEILKIDNIKKTYHTKTVLNIKEISIQKGKVYGLIGPNGAGKSTLMKIISSLVKADSGTVKLFGKVLSEKNRTELLKHMGVFIEGPSYYGHLTGGENMRIIQHLKGLNNSDITNAIEYVGLANELHKKVDNYSLGMKQRLGLAMSLAGNPPFMILDEPTNGLDPQGIKEIRNLIVSLSKRKGITIMISSHILDEIEKMADYIGIIHHGELLYQGLCSDFKNSFGSEIALKTSDNEAAFRCLASCHPTLENDYVSINNTNDFDISNIIKKLHSSTIDVYRVYDVSKSLEDLFIQLTGKGSL